MAAISNRDFVAAMLDQPNNALLRKFTPFGYSLLLRLQSEIGAKEAEYEKALESMISLQRRSGPLQAAGIISSPEIDNEQRALIADLENKLIKYYMLLYSFRLVQRFQEPNHIELASFKATLQNKLDIDTTGTPWENEHDLVHVFNKRSQPLDGLSTFLLHQIHSWRNSSKLRAVIEWLPNSVSRRLSLPEWEISDDRAIPIVFRRDVLEKWVAWIVIFLAPTISVASMFALYAIASTWIRMAVVWIFSVIFAAMVHFLTGELNIPLVFSMTAAFCAVLVVFVGSAPP